ncbi:unnamed protein product [Blumeria hordei]|uniref:Uncharacterized protein n=1 Tax=Blumeria hordei TaxID=2867405 RepID=A0A383ULJ0_BLUHO|nr:unnamed protein product [Blumeria hordei]
MRSPALSPAQTIRPRIFTYALKPTSLQPSDTLHYPSFNFLLQSRNCKLFIRIITMSLNWVMTTPQDPGFIRLPNEHILYKSPSRTSIDISSTTEIPSAQPFSIKCDSGTVYITNQRLVYLPTKPSSDLKSFSSPILNLQDTYVHAPFFGANYWVGLCKPVPGGGVPPPHPVVDVKLTFREGGAFQFHSIFEQIKERLNQTCATAHENFRQGVDFSYVDLEPLPVYRPSREDDIPPALTSLNNTFENEDCIPRSNLSENNNLRPIPDEAPPGYEEMQAQAVWMEVERGLRLEAGRAASAA